MSSRFASELKKLLSSPASSHIRSLTAEFWVGTDGVVHSAAGSCAPSAVAAVSSRSVYGSSRSAPSRPGVPGAKKALSMEQVHAAECCDRCTGYGMMWSTGWGRNSLVAAVESLEDARTRKVSALKVTKSTSASALQQRASDLEAYTRSLSRLIESGTLPADVVSAMEDLVGELEEGRVKLQSLSRSDVGRSKVEEKLKALMVPKRFQGQSIALDESLCIIGISPAPSRRAKNQVVAAIEAYAIRNDTAAVLVAPAFVYSFLLQQLFPKSNSDVLVVSAPAPVEQSVRETAAGIWDPEGESSLACMQAAIDAARAITG